MVEICEGDGWQRGALINLKSSIRLPQLRSLRIVSIQPFVCAKHHNDVLVLIPLPFDFGQTYRIPNIEANRIKIRFQRSIRIKNINTGNDG